MEMKTYALSPLGISKTLKKVFLRTCIIYGIILLGLIGLNIWADRPEESSTITIITTIGLVGLVAFGLWRGWRQNKEILESVRIELTDEYIGRSQVRIPQVRINRQAVTSIEEINEGICIRTADKSRSLAIPNYLDENDYQEIINKLSSWSTIQPRSPKTKLLNIILNIILIISMGIIFLSYSLWLVVAGGLSLIAIYGYYYWYLRKAEGVDPRFRRYMLFGFLFLLLITINKICVLSGAIDLLPRSQ